MYHDEPDYEHNVYVAAKFGNLKTFQHVLYAYLNYNYPAVEDDDRRDPLSFSKLKSLAEQNSDYKVLQYIFYYKRIGIVINCFKCGLVK